MQLVNTSSMNNISAILTAACVYSTYEVESTRDIVQIWNNIKSKLKLKNNLEFVSAILATGRIMHGTTETKDPDSVQEVIETFNNEVSRRLEPSDITQREFCAGQLSAACVSRSKKLVSAKDIVNLWDDVRKNLKISSDSDIISTVLTAGRIVDTSCQTEGYVIISDMFENVTSEVSKHSGDIDMGQRALASAYMTAAAVEITPKVEKIRDMVNAWITLYQQLKVSNDNEFIAAILTSGRIKDLNATQFMVPESITDIHSKIVEYITELE